MELDSEMKRLQKLAYKLRKKDKLFTRLKRNSTRVQLLVRKYSDHPWEVYTGKGYGKLSYFKYTSPVIFFMKINASDE